VSQVQSSIALALSSGASLILYTEPDKERFFAEQLKDFSHAAASIRDGPVVLAARSEESFGTFPPLQRLTEGAVHCLCSELTCAPGDYLYGPFMMTASLARVVSDVPADVGWGWRPYMFLVAHEGGPRIVHLAGDYPCPGDQRAEDADERVHRLPQLQENVAGLVAYHMRRASLTS
jgi:hypothetical protein